MSESWIDNLKEEGGVRPRRTLAEEAADNLREFILLGKLAPGTAIPERDLADALGVSRTPLREALRLLEIEGLVEYSATRRPRVADPSLHELTQYISVLGALEALAGEMACIEATMAEIAEIVRLGARMFKNSSRLEPLEFFQLDMQFHAAIVEASRNEPLIETHRQYNARLWRARFLSSQQVDRRDNTLAQHADITDALQRRDAKATRRALRDHLKSTIENIARIHSDDADRAPEE
ncbi:MULTISPECIES: GntR family transcriptional regulator [Ruegeria]|uniref:Putative HTH-type transcriptional regulator YdfH n=1 Tax=Ruegeria atlantica TaxID=81569 RepID=A0A0P1EC27_9RHOB|nr:MULTISPECIES: GntR family transcriptional regulator [Ruegeria]CUH46609.1 putative HTH-type transcriptional regulator YdfH [Ruegeria atlantica]